MEETKEQKLEKLQKEINKLIEQREKLKSGVADVPEDRKGW